MSFELPHSLRALTPHVYVWLPDGHATWGMANCVLIAGEGSALLVDTPYTAQMTRHLQRLAADVLAPGTHIDTVVNTHGNGDHSYGNALFAADPAAPGRPAAEIISTEANGDHLCAEPTPAVLAGLVADSDPDTALGGYLRRHFGRFGDFGVSQIVPPTRTFSGRLDLDVGGVAVQLIEVGPAHTAGDLIVNLPDEGIVCAGDVVFCDDHPVHWAGPIEEIHRATLRVLECEPRVVVAGHGPVMTPADVRGYAGYLLELRERLHAAHAAGRPVADISAELIATDTRPHWGLTERMAILASIEYRALDGDDAAPNLIRLVDFAAGLIARAAPAAGAPATAALPPF
jgi:glyoxylase-like metal-dependent hydrolase (beta-lactamase superfamily II)